MKFILLILLFSVNSYAGFDADLSAQLRAFNQEGVQSNEQEQYYGAFAFEPKYNVSWNNDSDKFTVELFGRLDTVDNDRSHFDIRQLDWTKYTNDWEFRVGISKIFWGVTESVHLVDIVNQTDFVENFDGEQKLGQPMVNVAWVKEFGTFDFYALFFFREQTYPGEKGRFRFGLPLADSIAYESSEEEAHTDFAFRWSHTLGDFDLGLSYFNGTSRDPRFVFKNFELEVTHDLIWQVGLDVQWTYKAWSWKLEAINREWKPDNYLATAFGFEYTWGNFYKGADLGVLIEHLTDSRDLIDLTTPFENDIFIGSRLALNDENDFQLLAGVIFDLEYSTKFLNVEASRRLSNSFQVSLENRSFIDVDKEDGFVTNFKTESYTQLELTYSF